MIDREFARLAAASGRRELSSNQQKLRFPAYTHVWMKYVLNVANGGHLYRSSKAGIEAELLNYDGIMTALVVPFNKHQLSTASPRHYDTTGRRFETESVGPLLSFVLDELDMRDSVSAVRSFLPTPEDLAWLRDLTD